MTEQEKLQAAEAKLQNLRKRLNQGLEATHPVREKHLQKVREIVREQWEQEQHRSPVQGEEKRLDLPEAEPGQSTKEKEQNLTQDLESQSQQQETNQEQEQDLDQEQDQGY